MGGKDGRRAKDSPATTRLYWTVRLGIVFLIVAFCGLAILQFGILRYSAAPMAVKVDLQNTCDHVVRPTLDVRADGILKLTLVQNEIGTFREDEEGVTVVPDAFGRCINPTVHINEQEADLGENLISNGPPEFTTHRSRNLRAGISVNAERLLYNQQTGIPDSFESVDALTLDIDLDDRGFGFNPSEIDIWLLWSLGPYDGRPDGNGGPLGEGLGIENNCPGCIVTVGTDVIPTGQRTDVKLAELEDGITIPKALRLPTERRHAYFQARDDGRTGVEIDLSIRIEDPAREARESTISNLLFILIGAAFSLLTEAFLLSPLLKGRETVHSDDAPNDKDS